MIPPIAGPPPSGGQPPIARARTLPSGSLFRNYTLRHDVDSSSNSPSGDNRRPTAYRRSRSFDSSGPHDDAGDQDDENPLRRMKTLLDPALATLRDVLVQKAMELTTGPTSSSANQNDLNNKSFAFGDDADDGAMFEPEMQRFTFSQQEVVSILNEEEAFQTLKLSLRLRGCVTNAYLKENMHFYVQHVRQVRTRRVELEQQLSNNSIHFGVETDEEDPNININNHRHHDHHHHRKKKKRSSSKSSTSSNNKPRRRPRRHRRQRGAEETTEAV